MISLRYDKAVHQFAYLQFYQRVVPVPTVDSSSQGRDVSVDDRGADDHGCCRHDDLRQERNSEAGELVHGAFEDVHGEELDVVARSM